MSGPRHAMPIIGRLRNCLTPRLIRFVANGILATLVNYAVLSLLVERVGLGSTGAAALLAALAGITASFIGNRRFVFVSRAPLLPELLRFKSLYLALAIFQALFMAVWSDFGGLDYTTGFIVATAASFLLSYLGNRLFVFR